MALTLVVAKTAISSDGGTITIEDQTGSGATGYGGSNPARSALFLKLYVTLKKSTGDEQITVDSYNEQTVTTWSVAITEDGYYEIYMFAAPAFNGATAYTTAYVVYDSGTDKFYSSVEGGTHATITDTLYWTPVTDVSQLKAAIAAGQATAYYDVYEYIELYNSRVSKARAYIAEDCCSENASCGTSLYQKIRNLIDGAAINEAITAYAKAQTIVEQVQSLSEQIDPSEE